MLPFWMPAPQPLTVIHLPWLRANVVWNGLLNCPGQTVGRASAPCVPIWAIMPLENQECSQYRNRSTWLIVAPARSPVMSCHAHAPPWMPVPFSALPWYMADPTSVLNDPSAPLDRDQLPKQAIVRVTVSVVGGAG